MPHKHPHYVASDRRLAILSAFCGVVVPLLVVARRCMCASACTGPRCVRVRVRAEVGNERDRAQACARSCEERLDLGPGSAQPIFEIFGRNFGGVGRRLALLGLCVLPFWMDAWDARKGRILSRPLAGILEVLHACLSAATARRLPSWTRSPYTAVRSRLTAAAAAALHAARCRSRRRRRWLQGVCGGLEETRAQDLLRLTRTPAWAGAALT
jgi:hypothetical protein